MKIVPIASASIFLVACCLPALEFNKENASDVLSGASVLGVGWSGIFAGVFGWYANPIWLLGVVMAFLNKPKLAAIAAIVAFAVGCTTFTMFGRVLPADEGNVTHMTLVRLLPGAYLWLASLLAPALALLINR